ncbi:hypothetical protein UlMin_030460 [Ulmus minor]
MMAESTTFPIDLTKTVFQLHGESIVTIQPTNIFRFVVASPADLVKVRLQADVCMACQGLPQRYSGAFDAFTKITIKIEGLKALWKGFFPIWAKLGSWQFVFWVPYENFRQIAGLFSF